MSGVDTGALARTLYSADASLYRVVPAAVAAPRHPDEVLAAVQVCRELGVPLTVRGAGTSVAGNAVGPGLVLDLSRHLDRITDLDPDARTATVQPGVVHADLQRAAARYGLRFGPDPSSADRCTVGGMIGNDACGPRALGYGRTSHNVLALDAVAGTGELLRLGPAGAGSHPPGGAELAAARRAVAADLGCVRTEFDTFTRQVSGYALEHLLPERADAVHRVLVGSEGTLAVVLGATVRLVPEPAHRRLVVLGYPSMAEAADAVPGLLPLHPTACEGLDRRPVDVVRHRYGPAWLPDMPRGSGWLLVELTGDDAADVAARAAAVPAAGDALDFRLLQDPVRAARLWRARADGAGLIARTRNGAPAHAGWEDAAVPPAALGAYLREFDDLLDAHGLTGLPYGHFGEGCVHVRLDFPFGRGDGTARFGAFLTDAARLVAAHGGSLSGEHGDGRARSALLPHLYSARALALFRAVKQAFDPDGVLNPGVLVDPAPATADLRPARPVVPALARPPRPGLAHRADAGDFAAAAHRCTGVGACRADRSATGAVMCPSYQATRDEKDSTRGRARVLQEMLDGTLLPGGWRSPEVAAALDLCLSCKACASECPSGVDLAALRAEVLYQAYRHRIRPRSHYALGRLPVWTRLAGRAPRVTNAALDVPFAAAVARWAAGIDPRRGLPRFATERFRDWFVRRGTADPEGEAPGPVLPGPGTPGPAVPGDGATVAGPGGAGGQRDDGSDGTVAPAPGTVPALAPTPDPGPAPASAPALAPDPTLESVPDPAPAPAPESVPGPTPDPASAPASVPTPAPVPEPVPVPGRAPAPVPVAPGARGPVLLWVDDFTDRFAPQVGRATVAVLRAAGFRVVIPDEPVCCGITWISTGQLDGARRRLAHAARVLGPQLDAGMPVLVLEPSCAAVLRGDARDLLDTPAIRMLAERTVTLAELLTRTDGWVPPSLAGLRVLAQPHCHHRAVLGWEADARLLAAAGAEVEEVPGCCGLAGDFGMVRGHYTVSVAVAEQHLLPAVRAAGPDTVILADGFSCRTQLDDLAGRGALHLAELLAAALPGGTVPR